MLWKQLGKLDVSVKGMAAIFTYGFGIAQDNFKGANCKLAALRVTTLAY